MKVRLACLSMGALLCLAGTPARAADWGGGIKDMGGGVGTPIPAPVPVANYAAEYYIGIVTGGVLVDDSTITEVGSGMPVRDSGDLAKTLFGGVSAGKYLTPSLRAELAFDFYDDFKVTQPFETKFQTTRSASNVDATYDVTRAESAKVGRTTGMINLLYDLPIDSRFKPYVGGGVGVTWRSLRRNWHENGTCAQTVDNNNNPSTTSSTCAALPASLSSTYKDDGESKTDRFDVALAAIAGFSIEITPSIIWDNGYQLLWESNNIQLTTQTHCGGGTLCDSTVSYGSTLQHQFRTGLRFNID